MGFTIIVTLLPALAAAARVAPRSREFNIVNLGDEELTVAKRMRVTKTAGYHDIWPQSCAGKTKSGQTEYSDATTDGFACELSTGLVALPYAPLWFKDAQTKKIGGRCCSGECVDAMYMKDCRSADLQVATAKMLPFINVLSVEGAGSIDVIHKVVSDAAKEEGVMLELTLRVEESQIKFDTGSSALTEESGKLMKTLAEKMSVLLTVLQTATDGGSVLLCPHGATTRCVSRAVAAKYPCEVIAPSFLELPLQRAHTLGENLKQYLPGVGVGASNAHYAYEQKGAFAGGRFGAVLIKVYHKDREQPQCHHEDFYGYPELVQATA